MDNELDTVVRLAAFSFLEEQIHLAGDVLPRTVLQEGFVFRDRRVPLMGPQGIFKPAILEHIPLTITTAPPVEGKPPPYEDEISESGFIKYRYRGTDPAHRENVGLRSAMQSGTPLIYLFGVVPGQYAPAWPVFMIGDDPANLTFTVAVDEQHSLVQPDREDFLNEARRVYVTRLTRQRLHQASFRQRVIQAYRKMCAVCSLRHAELLDAAHILPDSDPRGEPLVTNGLALCKLHHAAFDTNILGVRPDLKIEVSAKVLAEVDGPMLIHGIQGFHGGQLQVPSRKALHPNPEFLSERYEIFRATA